MHKQTELSKFPETFIINGHEETHMKHIPDEFNNFFVGIGTTINDSICVPVKQFKEQTDALNARKVSMVYPGK